MGCGPSIFSCGKSSLRIDIDNLSSPTATLIKVERKQQKALLDVVQTLGNLNLSINKGFISYDSDSFIDVFHVTDQEGGKLSRYVIDYIQRSVGSRIPQMSEDNQSLMKLELSGKDQPGLLSEVFTVIADLQGNVVDAKVWTHNGRYALLIYFKYEDAGYVLSDSQKVVLIEAQLKKVVKGDHRVRASNTHTSMGDTDTERRLHQLLFDGRDYDRSLSSGSGAAEPMVSVEDRRVRGYLAVNVVCKDRQKLLFDIVCSLTNMKFVIFIATMNSDSGSQASLKFFIRNQDWTPINSEAERCLTNELQAAIQIRAFEGYMLELEAPDRRGVLAAVTRTLKDEGLNVTGAVVSSGNQKAANVFYVSPHVAGHRVEATAIEEAVRQKIGPSTLRLKKPLHVA